jgi:hypothetical protein
MKTLATLVIAAAAGTSSAVGPIIAVIDPSQSTVTARLCIIGSCTQDTSPVTGSFTLFIDSSPNPTEISATDFNMNLTENLTLNISFGILGRFNSSGTGISVAYADPGTPIGPVPLTAGAFEFVDVPAAAEGTLQYSATGIVCSALQGAGYLCTDSIDLAGLGVNNADSVAGSFSITNNIATMSGSVHLLVPIDADNPDLGTIEITGNIVASGPVPGGCPADFNGDNQVDFFDYLDFAQAFDNEDPSADFNGDNQVDFFDYLDFAQAFDEGCN